MKGDKTMFENQLGLQEQLDVMKQYGIVFDTGAPIRGILANVSERRCYGYSSKQRYSC